MPHEYASKVSTVKDTENGFISILVDDKVAVTHKLSEARGKTIIVSKHYQGIPSNKRDFQKRKLPLLNQASFPQVRKRPLSVYEEVAGGRR